MSNTKKQDLLESIVQRVDRIKYISSNTLDDHQITPYDALREIKKISTQIVEDYLGSAEE